jgi:hypothetical protein
MNDDLSMKTCVTRDDSVERAKSPCKRAAKIS